jgi:hypothetical protein
VVAQAQNADPYESLSSLPIDKNLIIVFPKCQRAYLSVSRMNAVKRAVRTRLRPDYQSHGTQSFDAVQKGQKGLDFLKEFS